MKINSDINILGGLPDWQLIEEVLKEKFELSTVHESKHYYGAIKTAKSVKRFEKVISNILVKFENEQTKTLVYDIITSEGISIDSRLILFWNASFNNELLNYLNNQIYFSSYYSGRIKIKQDEVSACLKDLREREPELKKWSDLTLKTTASKYLTLLKKFNLMEGTLNKNIIHPYLNDKMFILFIYWISSIELKSNLLESEWLKYSFCEQKVFIERLMQKKFARHFHLSYTGDKLKIETTTPYEKIYDAVK